ncbi:MAG: thiolase family protein [Gammaproteobacteria bacterium]
MTHLARAVAIGGVGYSPITRGGGVDPRAIALTACRAALDDAGAGARDIDAIFEYRIDAESPDCHYVQRALGVPDLAAYADVMASGPSGLASVLSAITAVASGACECALVFRCFTELAGRMGRVQETASQVGGRDQFLAPYGISRAFVAHNIAMKMRRRIHELGGSPDDFGVVAVNARRWSQDNPRAALRQPLTLADYRAGKVIADPLRIYDCDYPVNGACAVIVTTTERARSLRRQPIHVDAIAYGTGGDDDWLFADRFLSGGMQACADRLWGRSSFRPADVQVGGIYDGFTYSLVAWIEALGICAPGEFHDWVDGGRRIGPGGSFPINTAGGHLAEGRLHGVNLLAEVVLQLRGECGVRQVPDARVGVVTSGLGPQCGALVLHGA